MDRELGARGQQVVREAPVDIMYMQEVIAMQRIDFLVDGRLILEIKSAPALHKSAPRQVFNYLRATNIEVGLLLHFGRQPQFFRLISENA